jgi:hypothetical protein
MLASVLGFKVALGLPATVTSPGLVGWVKWRALAADGRRPASRADPPRQRGPVVSPAARTTAAAAGVGGVCSALAAVGWLVVVLAAVVAALALCLAGWALNSRDRTGNLIQIICVVRKANEVPLLADPSHRYRDDG